MDTSTFFDIRRAPNLRSTTWAQNTIYNLVQYQSQFSELTISAFTVFEHLDGLHRQERLTEVGEFLVKVLPSLEVIYPDEPTFALAAKIYAALAVSGTSIGIADTFIAASAIERKLTLVNANTRHFQRVIDAGFSLQIGNWRYIH